jgi:hypothetical protein
MHSWNQGMLATNESLYPWMDEGFTNYAAARVWGYLNKDTGFVQESNYNSYFNLAKSNKEEPLSTHADHYNTNYAYTAGVYGKGAVFMEQLGYIVGAQVRDKILLEYYRLWRFKHPNAQDFINVAEKVSHMKLDWYKEYWIYSTKTIDYAIDSLWEENARPDDPVGRGKTNIRIKDIGLIPMPVDLQLTFKDGTKEMHYIPLDLMYGEKRAENDSIPRKVYDAWHWTNPTYTIQTDHRLTDITIVEIDPSQRMADIDRKNNRLELKW